MTKQIKIGVIGCGNISGIYLNNFRKLFNFLDIIACADLDPAKSRARADEFNIPRACTVKKLLSDPDIDIVVNLTIPTAHAKVNLAAITAGKHVYCEKPLAINRKDGLEVLRAADKKKLLVGCAPDTFLGAGFQTCRKLIDDGAIGEPLAATAFMVCRGHESWHPNPGFYYQPGGGPMFDMGPYYLTALISLMGPVRRVTGSTKITFPKRIITSQPNYGKTIKVNTPTHIAGIMDFTNGAIGTITTSFDIWDAQLPKIEIYGSEGTLNAPDPNTFGGPIRLLRAREKKWIDVPLIDRYAENSRGVGVADMAQAILSGNTHRANGKMAYHVLDIMQSFHDASALGKHIKITSSCAQPKSLPVNLFS
ncbi:MAG: Gfo/Idh/MocA family oxidoreductase [Candidatus Omnitrophica bacterium]|nr:Gfo/Idh/MocA family oxidoreductase [Candidatus Omnitrophota bacterium]